jgi:hypothetical protein
MSTLTNLGYSIIPPNVTPTGLFTQIAQARQFEQVVAQLRKP